MPRYLFAPVRHFKNSFLVLLLIVFLPGCGGGDSGSTTPTFNLTVSLFDQLAGGSPSGDKVNISELGGTIDFTCFQSEQNQDVTVDSRCEIVGSSANGSGSGASIRFNSLPTEKTYTLTHFDAVDVSAGNCSVVIESSSSFVAQSPCAKVGDNSVTMTLNSSVTP